MGWVAVGPSAQAFTTDIVADGSLGTTVTATGPQYDIGGGTLAGGNQFHSFESFSVGTGDAAVFNGPASIANVISRVTGGSASGIDGTVASTIAGANVFLLNPAGVMFGPNAQISVDGAFHASTANYLRMADGERFYVDTAQSSTLTTAEPAAFGFLDANPAGISVQGGGFADRPAGSDLSLVGGELTVSGATLYAPLGRINLAAVGPGTAEGVEATLTAGAVDVDAFDTLGPVSIDGGSYIDTSALYIRGGQITVSDAYLSPGVAALLLRLPAPDAHINNGLIDIQARGDLTVTSGSSRTLIGSTLQQLFQPPARRPAAGDGATVLLEAGDTLSIQGTSGVSNSTVIGTDRWTTGPAGSLSLKAEQIEILGTRDIYALNYAPGAGPNTSVEAQTVTVNNGAIRARNFGGGDNGNVQFLADAVTLTNQLGPTTIGAENYGSGNGGAIVIAADSLELNTPGEGTVLISGRAFGPGDGAAVEIGTASDPSNAVMLQGDGAAARVLTSTVNRGGFSRGRAGDIEIHTGTLTQVGDTEIGANSFSNGDGGNVAVLASEAVRMSGTDAATGSVIAAGSSAGQFTGAGGSITIESPLLEMTNASITTRTQRASDAGGVDIRVGTLTAADSTINSDTFNDGHAGSVTVNADRVALTDGAQIRSFSGAVSTVSGDVLVGSGDAGSVTVTATESLSVSGISPATNRSSVLSTQTRGDGAGGALNVTAGQLTVGQGGLIAADTGGDGAGGALMVSADTVLVDGGEISSGSGISVAITNGQVNLIGSGDGGDVTVTARNGVTVQNGGRIAASSGLPGVDQDPEFAGDAGNITVDGGSEVQLVGGSIETESLFSSGGDVKVDADTLIYLFGGKITTSVVGKGDTGGNIDVDPEFVVLQNGSQVIANARQAVQAGNIRIVGDYILISQDSLVEASGPTNAQDGEIVIEGPDGELDRALAQLPESYLEAAGLLKAGCGAGRAGVSTLALTGRGGVPVSPDRYLPAIVTGVSAAKMDVTAMNQPLDGERLAFGPSDPTAAGWLLADLGCR